MGCKPYSGAGINPRPAFKTTMLKSVDDTYYYADNLENPEKVEYTLFGHNGDQDENEKKFNEPFLNPEKTEHIYLYRVTKDRKQKYIWYGKYKIVGRTIKRNVGKDYAMRNIIVLSMVKI
jgi:hypothetical protein